MMGLEVQDLLKLPINDLLSGLGQLLIGLGIFGNMILSWRNGRKIKEVHDATNGMKADLIKATQVAGEAKGRQDERKDRQTHADKKNLCVVDKCPLRSPPMDDE